VTQPPDGRELFGLHVLLVDDEVDGRDVLKELLLAYGARVTTAGSAEEAWQRLREEKPDVLVTDIGMPDESGLALLRRIRQLPEGDGGGIPAIAITGWSSPGDAKLALAHGFQAHLAKPFSLNKLVDALMRLARRVEPTPPSVER
jgi:CheY-like chemotaxis protein